MHCEQCGAPTAHDRVRCRNCLAGGTPVGVRIAGALAGLGGLLTSLLGLTFVGSGAVFLFVVLLLVGLGLAQVGVARGLWNAEYWAWGWGVTLYVLNAAVVLGAGILVNGTTTVIASAVLAGLIAAYIYGHHGEFTAGTGPAAAGR